MNTKLAAFLSGLLVVGLGTAAGCGSPTESSGDDAGRADSRPSGPATVEQARTADVGERLRVQGSLLLSSTGAVMCDALAESYPPQCPDGLPVRGFHRTDMPPDAESASGVTWSNQLELEAERTASGLRYIGG